MKVLLILPPNIGRYIVATIPHAGFAYLISFLEKEDHEVEIQDMRIYSENEDLIKKSAPVAGFTPAIRLGLNDPEFACQLFEGAFDERQKCNNGDLVGRINRIKDFILNSHSQKETSSTN